METERLYKLTLEAIYDESVGLTPEYLQCIYLFDNDTIRTAIIDILFDSDDQYDTDSIISHCLNIYLDDMYIKNNNSLIATASLYDEFGIEVSSEIRSKVELDPIIKSISKIIGVKPYYYEYN